MKKLKLEIEILIDDVDESDYIQCMIEETLNEEYSCYLIKEISINEIQE